MKHKQLTPLFRLLAAFLVLAMFALPGSPALAADTGLRMPYGAMSVSHSVEDMAWLHPVDIRMPDAPYAYVNLSSVGSVSEYLQATDYQFSIPSGSTINGIEVKIGRYYTTGGVRDHQVRLVRANTVAGNDKANTAVEWPTGSSTATYGGPTDLWGTTWTAEQINAAGFGAALSATRSSPFYSVNASVSVDTIQVRVYYTLPGTTTTVSCGSGVGVYLSELTCTASVTRSAGSSTPAGVVSWATDSSGYFMVNSCLLSGSGGTATCSVTYTPFEVGDGSHQITAAYAGSASFTGSSGAQDVTVQKATPAIWLMNIPVTYDGQEHAATVMSSVDGTISNVRYNGMAEPPVDAGTYSVSADFVPYDTDNYTSLSGAPAGSMVIDPRDIMVIADYKTKVYGEADPALTYWVLGSLASGDAFTGELTRVTGENVGWYMINQGSLALSDNYILNFFGAELAITPATPTLTISNPQVIYNGQPQAAVVTSPVPGTVWDVRYNGVTQVPVKAGVYAIRAHFASDDPNYATRWDVAVGSFEIQKATPVLSASSPPVTYDGQPHAAVVAGSVPGDVGKIYYDGDETAPVNAGTYAVTADFVPADNNYETLVESPAGSFVIEKAVPALSVSNSPRVYDGQPQVVEIASSAPGTVENILYDGVATAPVNAGVYAVTADFIPEDTLNFESLSGAHAGIFEIEKATPVISVSNSPVVYDGESHAAIVEASVAGTVSNVLYDGQAALPVAPGAYAVRADFDSADTNYTSLSAAPAGTFIILAAGPALDLEKTAAEAAFSFVNDTIHYSYRLTNTGDVPLAGPFTVTDDRISVTCPQATSLAVAAALTCTGSDTITPEDLLAGKVTNTATGYGSYAGEQVVSNTAEATVTYQPANLYFPLIHRPVQDR